MTKLLHMQALQKSREWTPEDVGLQAATQKTDRDGKRSGAFSPCSWWRSGSLSGAASVSKWVSSNIRRHRTSQQRRMVFIIVHDPSLERCCPACPQEFMSIMERKTPLTRWYDRMPATFNGYLMPKQPA